MEESCIAFNISSKSVLQEEKDKVLKLSKDCLKIGLSLAIIILFLNIIVLCIFFVMGDARKKVSNILLLNQSFTDLLVSINIISFVLPDYTLSLLNDLYISITYYFYLYTSWVKLFALVLTTAERCFAVDKPFLHRKVVTRGRIKYVIIITWLLAFITPSTMATYNSYSLYSPVQPVFPTISLTVFLIFLIAIFGMLLLTFVRSKKSIRKHIILKRKRMDMDRRKHTDISRVLIREHQKEARLIKIFIFMTVAYLLSFMPVPIYSLILSSRTMNNNEISNVMLGTVAVLFLFAISSVFNPLLTFLLKNDFKKGLTKCFRNETTAVTRIQHVIAL